jgi:hypothetical protein
MEEIPWRKILPRFALLEHATAKTKYRGLSTAAKAPPPVEMTLFKGL